MQSLRARFNGNSEKVVEYARQFGTLRAMDKYEVKDLMAMEHFLEEVAPGVHFPMANFDPDSFGQPNAFDKLLEAMLRKYSALEARNAALDRENQDLKVKLDYFKANRWHEASAPVQAILRECGESK